MWITPFTHSQVHTLQRPSLPAAQPSALGGQLPSFSAGVPSPLWQEALLDRVPSRQFLSSVVFCLVHLAHKTIGFVGHSQCRLVPPPSLEQLKHDSSLSFVPIAHVETILHLLWWQHVEDCDFTAIHWQWHPLSQEFCGPHTEEEGPRHFPISKRRKGHSGLY